jgi:hypothetical protein
MEHLMSDDLLNAGTLALLCAVGAAAAASAFFGDAETPPATRFIARTDIVTLPTVVIVGQRRSAHRDLELASRE